MPHDGARPFEPACMTAEDLPPDNECPPDLTAEMWSFIDFLATPPNFRDLEWTEKLDRKRIDNMTQWCLANNVPTQTASKWHTNLWFQHYLGLIKEQRATHDIMVSQMLEQMYRNGLTGDQRAQRTYLDYVEKFGKPAAHGPMPGQDIPAGQVNPADMSDEQLNRMLAD